MKLRKKYPYAHFGALVLMPVYLFIVVAHLFFVPRFQGNLNPGRELVFKRNTEFVYYLIRNDRSTFNENKPAKNFPKNKPVFLISLLININHLPVTDAGGSSAFQYLPHHHHSYLLNHVIRIWLPRYLALFKTGKSPITNYASLPLKRVELFY